MAQRRMFSNRIANSARFLQMPIESQLLYFHMILRADDDGIVESYPLMKLLGVAPDNFKVLLAKGFIQQLNEDQVVVINDWKEHNVIRADRKIDSIYLPLLLANNPNIEILAPKPRSDVKDNSKRLGGQSTDGIGYVRLGKVKLDKDISEREKFNEYLILLRKTPEFLNKDIDFELKKFKDYLLANGKKYKDYCAAFRNWLRRSGDFTFKKVEVKGDNERMLERLNATRS